MGKHPWQVYADLLEETGSASALLERARESFDRQPSLFGEHDAELTPSGLLAVEAELEAWCSDGIRLVTVLDPDYPENLLAVHDRPPFVFVGGRLDDGDARSIAVIGSRRASERGLGTATEIAGHLAECGYAVVSGLAAGIDTAAHLAALTRGGRTIAVLGTGLRRSYPPKNAELQRRITAEGAVISQFWPDAPPSRRSFPMRNAVMSGISLATVIVEASATSGARTQARLALAHGRPVLLLAGLLTQPWARELAERPGTYVVDGPAEIVATVDRLTSPGTLVP
jgi:DNA processing protein